MGKTLKDQRMNTDMVSHLAGIPKRKLLMHFAIINLVYVIGTGYITIRESDCVSLDIRKFRKRIRVLCLSIIRIPECSRHSIRIQNSKVSHSA